MRNYAVLTVAIVAGLLAGSSAHAQQAYDITNCGENTNKVRESVDGALQRLMQIERAPANVFHQIYIKAFGDYSNDPDAATWLGALFASNFFNTRALLTGGTPVNPFGGALPTLPRVTFNCVPGPPVDIARYVGDGRVNLYSELFFALPNVGQYGSVQGSRVGTILHESIHVLGGKADIRVDGAYQNVSAEILVRNHDPRAFTNAENYEWFYMTFLF